MAEKYIKKPFSIAHCSYLMKSENEKRSFHEKGRIMAPFSIHCPATDIKYGKNAK
jgi:hypothetical protein